MEMAGDGQWRRTSSPRSATALNSDLADGELQVPASGLHVAVRWTDYVDKGDNALWMGRMLNNNMRVTCAALGFAMPWALSGRFVQRDPSCMLWETLLL